VVAAGDSLAGNRLPVFYRERVCSMRRLMVLTIASVLVVLGAVPAVASSEGELISAFHSELSQFNHPNFDGLDRPEGHITPFDGPGPVSICDDLVVGTWFTVFDEKDTLEAFSIEFRLDGVLLDSTRTPARGAKFLGEKSWILTTGVPVIGTLDAGIHSLEYDLFFDGLPIAVLSVEIDSNSC
jgi:hypothetical protein